MVRSPLPRSDALVHRDPGAGRLRRGATPGLHGAQLPSESFPLPGRLESGRLRGPPQSPGRGRSPPLDAEDARAVASRPPRLGRSGVPFRLFGSPRRPGFPRRAPAADDLPRRAPGRPLPGRDLFHVGHDGTSQDRPLEPRQPSRQRRNGPGLHHPPSVPTRRFSTPCPTFTPSASASVPFFPSSPATDRSSSPPFSPSPTPSTPSMPPRAPSSSPCRR